MLRLCSVPEERVIGDKGRLCEISTTFDMLVLRNVGDVRATLFWSVDSIPFLRTSCCWYHTIGTVLIASVNDIDPGSYIVTTHGRSISIGLLNHHGRRCHHLLSVRNQFQHILQEGNV